MSHTPDKDNYCTKCGLSKGFAPYSDPCGTHRWHHFPDMTLNASNQNCVFCGLRDNGQAISLSNCPGPSVVTQSGVVFTGISFGPSTTDTSFELGPEPKTPALDERPKCPKCQRELSAELDAYYGKSPWAANHCEPCRRTIERKCQ